MDIKQAFIGAVAEVLPNFGLISEYQGDIEEPILASASQVNVLIGFTDGFKGNVMVGFRKSTAEKVASAMIGRIGVEDLDDMAESAIGEIANLFVGCAMGKLQSELMINFSPPTLVIGERIFLMISRVKTSKLSFKLDEGIFNISFCLE